MTDKKLTDNEIIKALEELLKELKSKKQLIVPEQGVKNLCYGLQNFLDLINRLQTKNDRLEHQLETLCFTLKTAKAEAYKEVADRLRSIIMWSPKNHICITAKDVEEILQGLVGEDNA